MNDRIEKLGDAAVSELDKQTISGFSFRTGLQRRKARKKMVQGGFAGAVAVAAVVTAGIAVTNDEGQQTEVAAQPETAAQPMATSPTATNPTGEKNACGIDYEPGLENFWQNLQGYEALFGDGVISSVKEVEGGAVIETSQEIDPATLGPENKGRYEFIGPEVKTRWPADPTKTPDPERQLESKFDGDQFAVSVKTPGVHEGDVLVGNLSTLNEVFANADGCTTMSVTVEIDGAIYGPTVIDYSAEHANS